MADFRKEALIRTLREDYGITSDWQLFEALRTMPQLDISQFVLQPNMARDASKRTAEATQEDQRAQGAPA